MQIPAQQPGKLERAWYHFVESNYLTWFTDWMLKFGGKGAHSVLIITTLYMSAELFPGVHLPSGLNLTVFLLQMFMLDVGGLGLATLARQAREQGNIEGADQAGRLSKFLIGIMISGIVTVCVEQAISNFALTQDVQNWVNVIKIIIEVSLVVARAFCAVLYGVAIHSLKHDVTGQQNSVSQTPDYSKMLDDLRTQILAEMQSSLTSLRGEISAQIDSKIVVPEPLDYVAISSHLMPAIESKFGEFETSLSAQIPAPVDVSALALEVAALLPTGEVQSELDGGSTEGTDTLLEEDHQGEVIEGTNTSPEGELNREHQGEVTTHEQVPLHIVPRQSEEGTTRGNSTGNTRGNTEATKKIHRLLKQNSALGPTELAEKAGCSKRYASQVKQRYLASLQVS